MKSPPRIGCRIRTKTITPIQIAITPKASITEISRALNVRTDARRTGGRVRWVASADEAVQCQQLRGDVFVPGALPGCVATVVGFSVVALLRRAFVADEAIGHRLNLLGRRLTR